MIGENHEFYNQNQVPEKAEVEEFFGMPFHDFFNRELKQISGLSKRKAVQLLHKWSNGKIKISASTFWNIVNQEIRKGRIQGFQFNFTESQRLLREFENIRKEVYTHGKQEENV